MSLIPSESLNFPDSFRANVGWRLTDEPDENAPKQQAPVTAWPQAASVPAISQQGMTPAAGATADPDANLVAAHPNNEDAQLELQSNAPVASESPGSAAGTAEMTALLRHFLAAATTTASATAQQSIPATSTPSVELSAAQPGATNGQHDSIDDQTAKPNDIGNLPATGSPNRADVPA